MSEADHNDFTWGVNAVRCTLNSIYVLHVLVIRFAIMLIL